MVNKCPLCGEENRESATICQSCASDLPHQPVAPARQEAKPAKTPRKKDFVSEGSLVYTPSGPCPCFPKGTSPEQLEEWLYGVIEGGAVQKLRYSPQALKYFARMFWPMNSKEYSLICNIITEQMLG